MLRSPSGWLVGLLVFTSLGCGLMGGGEPDPTDASDVAEGDALDASQEPSKLASSNVSKPTFTSLQASVSPIAQDKEVPSGIQIVLSQALVDSAQVGNSVGADTQITLDPAERGAWRWVGPSRLGFFPEAEALSPSQDYKVTIKQLESAWGPIVPEGEAPVTAFTTAPFALLRVETVVATSSRVEVEAIYSGPLDAAALPKMSVEMNKKSYDAMFISNKPANRVRFSLPAASWSAKRETNATVSMTPAKGRTGAVVAKSANRLTFDASTKPMEIRRVELREGREGYYVDVVCHDQASSSPNYWWDRESRRSYEVSRHCMLDAESVKSALHFEPAVAELYVAEGTHGFRVMGKFSPGEVKFTLDAGARTVDGGTLGERNETMLTVKARSPRAELVSKSGRYLPLGGWKRLGVNHMNVEKVQVEVRQVRPENMLFWMSGSSERADNRTSTLVASSELSVRGKPDQVSTSFLDVESLVGADAAGLYEISVMPMVAEEEPEEEENVDTGWAGRQRRAEKALKRDYARFVMSDMQLVAKAAATLPDGSWAPLVDQWVIDTHTGKGRSGVTLNTVRANGDILGSCRTDSAGYCRVELPMTGVDKTAPIAITARSGKDFTYLKFADVMIPVSEQDVSGVGYVDNVPYLASLYADRGVFRPGDVVHLSTVVRDDAHRAPKDGLPVVLEVRDARNKLVRTLSTTTNEAGMQSWDIPLGSYASTGAWGAVLKAGERQIGALSFQVEEFVPERMAVTASVSAPGYLLRDPVPVNVDARYLFGGSAEGSPVELQCRVQPTSFRPATNGELAYGPLSVGEDAPEELNLGTVNGVLDAEGHAVLRCPSMSSQSSFAGPGKLLAEVSVFEAGSGRSTRQLVEVPVHPAEAYIGLSTGAEKAVVGKPLTVTGRVVDWQGKASRALSEVTVDVYRLEEEWGWWWYNDTSDWESAWQRHMRKVLESHQVVKVDAEGKFTLEHSPQAGSAGLLVRVGDANSYTDLRIKGAYQSYYWSARDGVDQTPRPLKPTQVSVKMPARVKVGEQVMATVDVPYRGRMLTTVETNQVVTWAWHDVEPGPFQWPVTVSEFVDDVYVSALVIKDPHLVSAESYAPERGFGLARARVTPEAFVHTVRLGVPAEVRPNSTLEVEVAVEAPKGAGKAYVTVAAVDEGILQLTRFKSPDPTNELFPRRRLGVSTYETVGWTMMMQAAGTTSSSGGDESGDAGRVQAVKPVALWSGLVEVPASGKIKIPLEVPQYRGQLRVMAVSATDGTIASASTKVLVRDPLTLQTTLPRFLAAGDSFEIPVFLTNMSGKDREITVSLAVEDLPWPGMDASMPAPPPVSLQGGTRTTFRLAPEKSKQVVFRGHADAAVGAARFTVKAESDGLVSYDTLDVPLSPAGARERILTQVQLDAGKRPLDDLLEGWLPTTTTAQVWVTRNPYARSLGHLEHLIRYPHGCIEQTTSSARPLLYVSALLPALPAEVKPGDVDKMLAKGVDRLFSMQTSSGGFGYWPGSDTPVYWGTAYATHFLLDAQRAGHPVPKERLESALKYLEREVGRADGSRAYDELRGSEAYFHYVLARAGRGQKARISTLLAVDAANPGGEMTEQRYMLMAALYLAGDRRYESKLRAVDVAPLRRDRSNSWTFYSDLRSRGLMLSVYQDVFGDADAGGAALARVVAQGLEGNSSHYSTQELVWGVTGLGRMVNANKSDLGKVNLLDGSRALSVDPGGSASQERFWTVARGAERPLVLDVPRQDGPLYVVMMVEGVREKPLINIGGEGLKLTRAYVDMDGDEVNESDLSLGELVNVVLTVTNTTGGRVQNLALTDRLPAGWEIENPRLGRGGGLNFVDSDELWSADYLDVRDDRINVFGALNSGESRKVVYQVRAVTPGQFTAPSAEMEAMYDPSLWARTPQRPVTVNSPWSDFHL